MEGENQHIDFVPLRNLTLQKLCSTTAVVTKHWVFFPPFCAHLRTLVKVLHFICAVQKQRLYPPKSNTHSSRPPRCPQVHSISPCLSAAFSVRVTLAPSSFPGQEEPPQNSQQKLGVRKFYLLFLVTGTAHLPGRMMPSYCEK